MLAIGSLAILLGQIVEALEYGGMAEHVSPLFRPDLAI